MGGDIVCAWHSMDKDIVYGTVWVGILYMHDTVWVRILYVHGTVIYKDIMCAWYSMGGDIVCMVQFRLLNFTQVLAVIYNWWGNLEDGCF